MTQKDRVKQRIKEVGYIDNVWCFNNRILRLAAIISGLKQDGYDFRTEMPPDKNCHYYPIRVKEVKTDIMAHPYSQATLDKRKHEEDLKRNGLL